MYAPSPRPGMPPIGRSASPAPGIPGAQQGYYGQPPIGRPISRGPSPAPPSMGGMPGPNPGYGAPPPPGAGYQVPYGPPPIARPISRGPSPAPPGAYGARSPVPHGSTSPSIGTSTITQAAGGFQIEKRARSPNPYGRPSTAQADQGAYRDEVVYREHVSALIQAKDRQIAVGGRIPVDPAQLSLFFRAKTGVSYTLDFPIDLAYTIPPAYDVLIQACRPRPRQTSDYDAYGEREALSFPPTLPLTATLELANYPILDAVKTSLFPDLPFGQHLSALRDGLDVIEHGSYISPSYPGQVGLRRGELGQRVATIIVTLPVRYRGGAIVVRDADGYREERYLGSGGKGPEIDWVAFRAEASYAIEPVLNGAMLTLSYGVYVRTFGPASVGGVNGPQDTLVTPSDAFFDLLSPILNMSRGLSVAFYLSWSYGIDPAEVVADALVPQLKGADALLYDAFKFHKLSPELHYSAGGFIWPADATLEAFGDPDAAALASTTNAMRNTSLGSGPPRPQPFGSAAASRGTVPPVRGAFGSYPDPATGGFGPGITEIDAIRSKVLASGGVPLVEAGVTLLTDYKAVGGGAVGGGVGPGGVLPGGGGGGGGGQQPIGKERVFFVNDNGELEKLVVNVLLVVYIP